MKLYHYYEPNGRVVHKQSAISDDWADLTSTDMDLPWVASETIRNGYVVGGELVEFPEQPTVHHVFNYDIQNWEDGRVLDDHKLAARIAIETRHAQMMAEPIEFRGSSLDADVTAQENIKSKLLEISEREALGREMDPELMFWRDADNQMHSFTSMTEYKEWLGSLAIEIVERGTRAYAWSWQKKAEVEAAQTLKDIEDLGLN